MRSVLLESTESKMDPIIAFFLSVDVLRFQHAPKLLLAALIVADVAVLWTDVWEVWIVWRALRALSFLDLLWTALRWFGRYLQNW